MPHSSNTHHMTGKVDSSRREDGGAARRETFRIRDLIVEVRAAMHEQVAAQGIEVEIDVPLGELIHADRRLLRHCLQNLMQNALDAMPGGGKLVITSVRGPSSFEIEVADSGPGVPSEIRRRVFDPYFTTRPGAAGLGLAIVRRIAEAHGGQVFARNCPEGGAAFTLRIPLFAREAAA